jgi:hypothetical protein
MRFESLQLKVCEGCGSLWFRSHAVMQVYCGSCARKLSRYPLVPAEGRPGRKRKLMAAMQGGVQ